MSSRFIRRVRTASGAVAVQIVDRAPGRVPAVEHVGSAHTDAELELLLESARERLLPGQLALDLGVVPRVPARVGDVADWSGRGRSSAVTSPAPGRPLGGTGRVIATSADLLWQVLAGAYARLGFEVLADEAFAKLVLARILEPTSKADSIRVLEETGVDAPSLTTIYRCLQRCQDRGYRDQIATACMAYSARHGGARAALVMYDVTPLHFQISDEDDLRRVGMSKEHRIDPQIQVGLLVDPTGFPLELHVFEGNRASLSSFLCKWFGLG